MTRFDVAQSRLGFREFILRGEIGQASLLCARHILGVERRASLAQMLAHRRFVERAREQTDAHLAWKIVDGIQRAAPDVRRQILDEPHAHPTFADEMNPIRFNLHRGRREVVDQDPVPQCAAEQGRWEAGMQSVLLCFLALVPLC